MVLVWNKPDDYSNIVDFKVYQNGEALSLASENNTQHSPAAPYISAFFQSDDADFHKQTLFLNFKATDLTPNTEYKFSVSAVNSDGTETPLSDGIIQKTAPAFTNIVNIADNGAIGDGTTVNTVIIQQAIDTCSENSESAYGCKVVIPANHPTANGNVFVTGALFLNSNMTLEIEAGATLLGSTNNDDYPLNQGYQLYSYKTNPTDSRRPPSLLNALSKDRRNGSVNEQAGYDYRRNQFENIRIVGGGTIDGNGWKRASSKTKDEVGNELVYHPAGNRSAVYSQGILALSQMHGAWKEIDSSWTTNSELEDLMSDDYGGYNGQRNKDYYSNRRSSLATFRGVTNMYFAELTLLNPAYHGVMFLEGENTVFAYTNTQTFDNNNADGVEFGNSAHSMIFSNFVDSGDDCINFAAGQGANYAEGSEHVLPTEHVWIFNNYLREGHGVVVLGSHTGAWIQDILAEENVAFLTDNGLRMKSTVPTGGGGRRVVFRDNAMKDIGTGNSNTVNGHSVKNRGGKGNPFIFTLSYSAGDNVFDDAPIPAQFKNITVENVTLDNVSNSSGNNLIQLDGFGGSDNYPETFHENFLFKNVDIKNSKTTSINRLKNAIFEDVTITNWSSGDTPWNFSNSENIQFIDTSPTHNNID